MSIHFHWQSLLLRVNGNQELGRRLLAAFLAEYVSPAAALADADAAGARLLLHRMVGSAGNLGLDSLAQACRHGESLVADGAFPEATAWRQAVTEVEEALRSTRAEVEDFLALPVTAAATPAADNHEAAPLAAQLAELLAANDLAALALVERWAQAVGAQDAAAILDSVHALDFPAAIRTLQDWIDRHD